MEYGTMIFHTKLKNLFEKNQSPLELYLKRKKKVCLPFSDGPKILEKNGLLFFFFFFFNTQFCI